MKLSIRWHFRSWMKPSNQVFRHTCGGFRCAWFAVGPMTLLVNT